MQFMTLTVAGWEVLGKACSVNSAGPLKVQPEVILGKDKGWCQKMDSNKQNGEDQSWQYTNFHQKMKIIGHRD